MKAIAHFIGLLVLGGLVAASGGWAVLALAYAGPPDDLFRRITSYNVCYTKLLRVQRQ